MRLFPSVSALLTTPHGRTAVLAPPFSGESSPGGGSNPAALRLYPRAGTIGTAAGRSALLLSPFTGEWTAGPEPDLPTDLLSALKALFLAGPAADLATGGIFLVRAGKRASLPYVVLDVVSASLSLTTSDSKVRKTRLRFRCYDDDGSTAEAIADALEDDFVDRTLSFEGGFTGPLVPGDRGPRFDPALSLAGNQGWYTLVEFNVMVRRGG